MVQVVVVSASNCVRSVLGTVSFFVSILCFVVCDIDIMCVLSHKSLTLSKN